MTNNKSLTGNLNKDLYYKAAMAYVYGDEKLREAGEALIKSNYFFDLSGGLEGKVILERLDELKRKEAK